MDNKLQAILTVVVIVGVGVGGFFLGRATKKSSARSNSAAIAQRAPKLQPPRPQASPKPASSQRLDIDISGLPVKGPEDAPITILEVSDFDCPFCTRGAQTLEQLMDKYPGKIRLAFQNLPLSFHRNSRLAAEAVLAAGDQGKFWEMYDRLFTLRGTDRESLINHAKALKLDLDKFTKCLDEESHKSRIDRDIKESERLKVTGTPSFFINGRLVRGAQPFEVFTMVIEEELSKAD